VSDADADRLEDEGATIECWNDQAFVVETIVLPTTHRVIGPQDPPRFKLTRDERNPHNRDGPFHRAEWDACSFDKFKDSIVGRMMRFSVDDGGEEPRSLTSGPENP
jgi:hypothetical protein